jgi:MFS transporter, DHA1 family, multidrug resistance protein
VRDTSTSETVVPRLAMLNVLLIVGPGLVPAIGGMLAARGGWRLPLAFISVLGLGTLVLTWALLPETGAAPKPPQLKLLLRDYAKLLRFSRFVGLAIGTGCSGSSLYAFITAAPFVFVNELGQPVLAVGMYLAGIVLSSAIGSLSAVRLAQKLPHAQFLMAGNLICILAIYALLGTVVTGHLTLVTTVVLMAIFTAGCGSTSPLAIAKAISGDSRMVGSAAGLFGCTQLAVGGLCATLASLGGRPSLSAVVVMAVSNTLARFAFRAAAGARLAAPLRLIREMIHQCVDERLGI